MDQDLGGPGPSNGAPDAGRAESRRARLLAALEASAAPRAVEAGRVLTAADGVAVIEGLGAVAAEELLTIDTPGGPCAALAQSLTEAQTRCLLLGSDAGVAAGAVARRTGQVLSVPVGDGLLGRVVDPLGRPLDGGPAIVAADHRPAECEPLAIDQRGHVRRPLATGILAIDALLPLGRGQRQLILGDRRTGKTTLAVDTLVRQRDGEGRAAGVVVIYAAIGQRSSATAAVVETLRAGGGFDRALVVVAGSDDPPGLQWLLPFAATTMAEYWVARGLDVVIVYDDLTKHAAVHREVSLLLRQAPGREAFPGDVFHLHARLLERAGQRSAAAGGGSLTALPIAELQAGNLTAYIPTNLVSITDGQILLDAKLWQAGQRPAIDVGLSVSRIGGRAQAPAMRQLAGRLKLDYAQFLDLESFARFGGVLEGEAAARLDHGRRVRAALVQRPGEILTEAGAVAILRAIETGAIDAVAPEAIAPLRRALDGALPRAAPGLVARLGAGQGLDEADWANLDRLIAEHGAAAPP